MTIFYNGRVCAVSVTELQARTIISMANQGNFTKQQQQSRQHCVAGSSQNDTAEAPPPPASPRDGLEAAAAAVAAPTVVNQAAASGLSMKRSLQRFLEKRKTRAAAAAPLYAGDRPAARR
ncbi:hypothetical protein E2562_017430 [Oryza meyeriana var. granulata]|uniref:Protein TIFY n=1 Tax=Oryza meyeriana var. granulata TaxID=110450 RepID=A0A6G1D3Q8_9ORYZ|nr:hypothetical protein E2562_017430 [Oryza meyeriana var. granulata]